MTVNPERTQAAAIANRWLDTPYADPDGDQCVVARQFDRSQQEIAMLRKLLSDLCGTDNHLSHCDRTMGATHPCTCGTRRAYRIINGLPVDE